jgi:hypothetical protein
VAGQFYWLRPGDLFLAEAKLWPEDMRDCFGDGDECHMAFHFPLMPRVYKATAQEDRHPVSEVLPQTPAWWRCDAPTGCCAVATTSRAARWWAAVCATSSGWHRTAAR